MKKLVTSLLSSAALGALALSCLSGCGADVKGDTYTDPDVTIKAETVADAVDISDLLFGTFLEDINYAGYALDDNLLANGNFEELKQGAATANYQNHWKALTGATFTVGDHQRGVQISRACPCKGDEVHLLCIHQGGGGFRCHRAHVRYL